MTKLKLDVFCSKNSKDKFPTNLTMCTGQDKIDDNFDFDVLVEKHFDHRLIRKTNFLHRLDRQILCFSAGKWSSLIFV